MEQTLRARTCCFTGHRGIDPVHEALLPALLEQTIRDLCALGVSRFVTGGALGFDTLAAEAVLRLRESRPSLHPTVIAPYLRQPSAWQERDRMRYERIRAAADDFRVLRMRYTKNCMRERNYAMVDLSSTCVSYCLHTPSGTQQTVDYALQNGLAVIDLAAKLPPL